MKQIFLLTAAGVLAALATACTQDDHAATSRPRKTYTAVDAPLGSHVRRVYTDDAPPAAGVSSAAAAGERPFASSSAGGFGTGGTR